MTLEWLAGFFDGEGCVRLECDRSGRRLCYYARLVVSQKDTGILRKIQSQFGGHLQKDNNASKLAWFGPEAIALAERLLPHSFCKHDQLLVLIESYNGESPHTRGDYADLLSALKKNIAA